MDNDLQNKLETEQAHSAFLEDLLRALYGDGWDDLTLLDAERYEIVRHPRVPNEYGRAYDEGLRAGRAEFAFE